MNEAHVSSTENFNAALRFASEADVLHLLTADDLVALDFYERLLSPLESVDGRALAYAAYEVIDGNGALVQGGTAQLLPATVSTANGYAVIADEGT